MMTLQLLSTADIIIIFVQAKLIHMLVVAAQVFRYKAKFPLIKSSKILTSHYLGWRTFIWEDQIREHPQKLWDWTGRRINNALAMRVKRREDRVVVIAVFPEGKTRVLATYSSMEDAAGFIHHPYHERIPIVYAHSKNNFKYAIHRLWPYYNDLLWDFARNEHGKPFSEFQKTRLKELDAEFTREVIWNVK